jgi:hypothetical protein
LNKAGALTYKINWVILKIFRTNLLSKADHIDTRQLWQVVQRSSNMKTKGRSCVPYKLSASCGTAEVLNVYPPDVDYSIEAVRSALQKAEEGFDESHFMPFTALDFDIILNKVKSTSPGSNCISHWFLRA